MIWASNALDICWACTPEILLSVQETARHSLRFQGACKILHEIVGMLDSHRKPDEGI